MVWGEEMSKIIPPFLSLLFFGNRTLKMARHYARCRVLFVLVGSEVPIGHPKDIKYYYVAVQDSENC